MAISNSMSVVREMRMRMFLVIMWDREGRIELMTCPAFRRASCVVVCASPRRESSPGASHLRYLRNHTLNPRHLLASGDLVLDGVVASRDDLGLEVHIDELQMVVNRIIQHALQESIIIAHLILIRSPLAVGVAIVDDLVRSRITDLDRRVGQSALGAPLDVVAAALADEERLRASNILIGINAFFDSIVHDRARGYRFGCKTC